MWLWTLPDGREIRNYRQRQWIDRAQTIKYQGKAYWIKELDGEIATKFGDSLGDILEQMGINEWEEAEELCVPMTL